MMIIVLKTRQHYKYYYIFSCNKKLNKIYSLQRYKSKILISSKNVMHFSKVYLMSSSFFNFLSPSSRNICHIFGIRLGNSFNFNSISFHENNIQKQNVW